NPNNIICYFNINYFNNLNVNNNNNLIKNNIKLNFKKNKLNINNLLKNNNNKLEYNLLSFINIEDNNNNIFILWEFCAERTKPILNYDNYYRCQNCYKYNYNLISLYKHIKLWHNTNNNNLTFKYQILNDKLIVIYVFPILEEKEKEKEIKNNNEYFFNW